MIDIKEIMCCRVRSDPMLKKRMIAENTSRGQFFTSGERSLVLRLDVHVQGNHICEITQSLEWVVIGSTKKRGT